MFKKLTHLWNAMQTSWQEDPAARGAAKIVLGGFLVFEGLLGTFRGSSEKKKGGIAGSIFGIVFGVAFIFAGSVADGAFQGQSASTQEFRTTALVQRNVERGISQSGDRLFSTVVGYRTEKGEYRALLPSMSSNPPKPGSHIEVLYQISDPEKIRTLESAQGFELTFTDMVTLPFKVVGWIVLLTSIFNLIVNIVVIIFGIYFLKEGRKDRKLAKTMNDSGSGSFVKDLFSIFMKIKSGELSIKDTAAGQKGASTGSEE